MIPAETPMRRILMSSAFFPLPALALLLALVFCATPSLAAIAAPDESDAKAKATPSLNPITAVNAMNQSIRASEQQTKAAMDSMTKAESKTPKAAPAAKPGGGKVIYGDIIIHK